MTGATFDPKGNSWYGEWREVRDDVGSFQSSLAESQATGVFSSSSGQVANLMQVSDHVAQLGSSRAITTLSANLESDVAITSVPINAIGEHLFDAGDTCILVNLKNGHVKQATISMNQGAADTVLHINSWTPDEDWYVGSLIYQSDKKLLSMIIQNEDAIILRVEYR